MLRNGLRLSIVSPRQQAGRVCVLNLSRTMAEGATGSGASRAGGIAQGDSFTRREKAQEDLYMKQKEQEKLTMLRQKLKEQRAHLDELDKHIEDMTRDQGGEHN